MRFRPSGSTCPTPPPPVTGLPIAATVRSGTTRTTRGSAESAIPWGAFASIGVPAPRPRDGETWRVAMYVLDVRPEGPYVAAWSAPLVGDFHVPERFGRLHFAP